MISRRRKARIRFLSALYRTIQKGARIPSNQEDEPSHLNLRYFVLGFAYQIVHGWTRDRDYGKIRTSYWRRFATFVALVAEFLRLMGSITDSERESLALGSAIGTVLYRLWYGVLSPLPSINE
jgi:hypothetical protein